MVQVVSDTEPAVVTSPAWQAELSALASGAIVGVATWILTYILSEYVIGMIACGTGSSLIACSSAPSVSAGLSLVFASLVGLTLLVRRRVFRPLLVVLMAAITLWGINGSWLDERNLANMLLTVLVSALVYVVFSWFAKIRQFWIAFVVSIVLVVLFRLVLSL